MSHEKVQLNVRVQKETVDKLNEIVQYYQKNTKYGTVYKGEVVEDLIDKAYEAMERKIAMTKKRGGRR
ncbi:hypothetical protein GJS40_08530 [Aliibacillus thermotolerans]|nr:hypothetical protein [Aliibacillus thermotolerans]MDA3130082.1 hypothetical protein [Aliibacillus thermotolerans]